MPNEEDRLDRAKQFVPFDALKGFREALKEKERQIDEHVELMEDAQNKIDKILHNIKIGDKVLITYYRDKCYKTDLILIKKISFNKQKIFLNDNIYYFRDIKNLEIID